MSLPFTPHTLIVQVAAEVPGQAPTYTDGKTIKGKLTAQTSKAVFEEYGVTLDDPLKLRYEITEKDTLKYHDLLKWVENGNLILQVETPPRAFLNGTELDSCTVICSSSQFR